MISRAEQISASPREGATPRPALLQMWGACAVPLRGLPLAVGSFAAAGAVGTIPGQVLLITPEVGLKTRWCHMDRLSWALFIS